MKTVTPLLTATVICLFAYNCSNKNTTVTENNETAKAEIERVLQIQEDAYNNRNDTNRAAIMAATCDDSLIFIGGDDGGMQTSAAFYSHDLADGYTVKPYEKFIRIFGNTAIVTGLQQAYKLFGKDSLYINVRSTKIFVKENNEWKMIYVTNTSLPVLYNKRVTLDPKLVDAYAGSYQSGTAADTLLADNGKLYFAVAGVPRDELIPINDSTFIGNGYFGKIIFRKDMNGRITGYAFEWNDGQQIFFPKLQ